jgi:hypothetical protein
MRIALSIAIYSDFAFQLCFKLQQIVQYTYLFIQFLEFSKLMEDFLKYLLKHQLYLIINGTEQALNLLRLSLVLEFEHIHE